MLNRFADFLIACAVLLALYGVFHYVVRLPLFPLREVRLTHAVSLVSREQIEALIKREARGNFFTIDLAALPTYTRSREFDGFRGFGIVRLADATEDPHATGLTFLNGEEADAEALPQPAIEDESHELLAFIDEDDEAAQDAGSIAEDEVPATEADAADDASDVVSAEEQHHDYTPPEFEAPVAAPALEPDYSDKVVHLEERRSRSRSSTPTRAPSACSTRRV